MWKQKWSRLIEFLSRPQSLVLLLLPCILALTLYILARSEADYERLQYLVFRGYNTSADIVDGYLVWNPKCHMVSKSPLDSSIIKFVKREKFESCSSQPLLTSISRESNGSVYLVINPDIAKNYNDLVCCWSPIIRPGLNPLKLQEEFDSKISVGQCEIFKDSVNIPKSIETISVSCTTSKSGKLYKSKIKSKVKVKKPTNGIVYDNVHAILNPERVRDRLNASEFRSINNSTNLNGRRALSVLMLGIDSVSRLNFHRSMPLTRNYMDEQGWLELRGYNKMGDNTFPNLMAFLTGQNQTLAYSKCTPKIPYGLDNCSFIWHNFRDAGYVTGYGEDHASISTFNYLKVGFVDPPTDYYLRPYILAAEKLLKSRQRYGAKYCTGPELHIDRVFNFAVDFAKTFISTPYFGLFWTNGISHENMNGPSSIDAHFLDKLHEMEAAGVMNDTMLIILSDHGMRYGNIRGTFVGWYEERLPFIYIWLPEWFREQEPEAYQALRINQNRLTSPYDLYETLRDILIRAGGQAQPSSGCPRCRSLFKPAPKERGCRDAGIAPHWCTCATFQPISMTDGIVVEGAHQFVEHMENIVKNYKNKKGARLCAKPRLKRIIRVDQVMELDRESLNETKLVLFYLLETTPGDGKFETTIRYHGGNNYTIHDEEVSRINSYYHSAKCLEQGYKQYCQCTK